LGETVREIGILLVVFYPMEFFKGGRITARWLTFWVLVSTASIAFGIFLEQS
jgi:hypothetical protein